MNGRRRSSAGPTRAAVAAILATAYLGLGGCALEGAFIGGWFGAILGQSAESVVAGAVVGAGVGAVLDSQDSSYWYQDYNSR